MTERKWAEVLREAEARVTAAHKYPKGSQSRHDLLAEAVQIVSEWKTAQEEKTSA